MQEILFWLVVIPTMSIPAIWTLRQWRHDYPLSSGAVDYRRIGRLHSPLVEIAADAFPLEYTGPYVHAISTERLAAMKALADAMSGAKLTFDAQNRPIFDDNGEMYLPILDSNREVATPSSGYTPLLSDDPYQADAPDETIPAPRIDPKLIGKEYR